MIIINCFMLILINKGLLLFGELALMSLNGSFNLKHTVLPSTTLTLHVFRGTGEGGGGVVKNHPKLQFYLSLPKW
jgi:hypothetical protein